MQFDKDDMTIIETLNEDEARAFIQFLLSERRRHGRDIVYIDKRIKETEERFKWNSDMR